MSGAGFLMQICGPFRLSRAGGRIEVSGRRSQALLAMLAASSGLERTRTWLQDRLWGSRGAAQAQASLRRELSTLRKLVNRDDAELLCSDHLRIWLDPELVEIVRDAALGDVLEGIDIPGEEGFEDWLREERARSQPVNSAGSMPGAQVTLSPINGALSALSIAAIEGSDEAEFALSERLSRIRWLQVMTGPGSARARFELKGRLRQEDGSGVLSLSLSDRVGGRMLWSGSFAADGVLVSPPSAIDEAVSAIRARIAQAEQATAMANPAANEASLIWQSQWHMHRMTREDALRAAELAARALDANPHGAEPLTQATWVRLWDLWVARAEDAAIRSVREKAQRAIIADHEDARGHCLAGIAEIWLMQPLRAEALLRRSVELDPSLIMARVQLGCALYHRLMLDEAEAELRTALRLSPNDQYLFFIAGELSTTCLMQDKWEEALHHAETALAARRSYIHGHVAKVNALVRLDRISEARAAHQELYRANPRYRPEFIDWIPFLDSRWNDFLKDGLNRAATAAD